MRPAAREFLRQRFADYYRSAHLIPPPAISEREWGVIPFTEGDRVRMRRHMSFADRGQLEEYIRGVVPAHVYYSSAYYAAPGAPTMQEKQWTGADLIFDLDADHLMRGDHLRRGEYHLMLERVREETEKLIGILVDELGFDPAKMNLVFSGGRGYHIHIRDLAVRHWGSRERREIVDYVCGTGINPDVLFNNTGMKSAWGRRYLLACRRYLNGIVSADPDEAVKRLCAIREIDKKRAHQFLRKAGKFIEDIKRGNPRPLLRNRTFEILRRNDQGFLDLLKEEAALADEPVTVDIKRLIRMPTSLHGGTGFRVTPLEPRELGDFDPLIDAVVFGERTVRVETPRPLTVRMLGNEYRVKDGVSGVPEAVAVFLCARGLAEIAGG
ncbi:MAG: DNA primase catalytic subunit PriS [Methanoculleaceae archaeon]